MPSSPIQEQNHSSWKDLRPPMLMPLLAEPGISTRPASATLRDPVFKSKQAQPSILTLLGSDLSSFSSAQTRPRRLTWVESERIWVVTSPSTGPPTVSSTWGDVNWSAAAYRPPPLQHSQSMDMTLAREAQPEPEPDDLPPPYERHYFDRPLPLLPPEAEMDPSPRAAGSVHRRKLETLSRPKTKTAGEKRRIAAKPAISRVTAHLHDQKVRAPVPDAWQTVICEVMHGQPITTHVNAGNAMPNTETEDADGVPGCTGPDSRSRN
ncbi:hypothetical protein CDV55_103475 [Aspergillus turcosus]|uniref:Uncharacterized protein n=1 Tax=Aspergillus turcosus TaxID=1245748 RepID=A0A397HRQ5_9EURO|nr:hypothetical protein CDV55_103475 [Aspergillus turcosus]RLL95421.1 hypothetical protein CFD26_103141 [Aspergillus turcosus]